MSRVILHEELSNIVYKIYDSSEGELKEMTGNLYMGVCEAETDINYLGVAMADPSKISYLTKAKIERALGEGLLDDLMWDQKYRVMAKPGGVIKKLFPSLSDVVIQEFNNRYKNLTRICFYCPSENTFEIVKGEQIKYYYSSDNYAEDVNEGSGESPLWCSCMRYTDCQKFLDIYTKNSAVSMAIFNEGGKISARCLLWSKGSLTYYDRIYAISDHINSQMQSCLEKRGFINISHSNIISPSEDTNITVELEFGENDLNYFPYCDTMSYLSGTSISNNYLPNSVELNETNGNHSGNTGEECIECGERFDEDDLYTITIGYHEGHSACGCCSAWSSYEQERILISEATETYYDGWILDEDVIELKNGRDCHKDNATLLWDGFYCYTDVEVICTAIDGEVFVEGDDNFVEIGGFYYYTKSDQIILEDGEYKLKEYA